MAAGDSVVDKLFHLFNQFLFLFWIQWQDGFGIQTHHLLIATDHPHFICRNAFTGFQQIIRINFFFLQQVR